MASKDLNHGVDLSLLTDLYELTMAQSYFRERMFAPATFSLFIRKFPPNRSYFIFAGLEDVLRYLESFHFSEASIAYLRSTGMFSQDFLEYLSRLRFTGDVWAIPEGRVFFCDEPVVEVTAPLIEAQLAESFLLNQISFQALIATKAARCTFAARGRLLVDFSLRRTHGVDAGMKVARCSYIAGFASTSNVMAGKAYGIPIAGTMAHSYVTSFQREIDSFRAFARSFPNNCILLIDTYDVLAGAHKAVKVAKELESQGKRLQGVRLDSGDLLTLSKSVRRILDHAGLRYVRIVASGGLDEHDVHDLLAAGAPIDSFGIGTKMGVSGDAPWLDSAYKLVKYAGRPVLKLSTGKATLPDEKQVYRFRNQDGIFLRDVIALRTEIVEKAEPLLVKVMEKGRVVSSVPILSAVRQRFAEEFHSLGDDFKTLTNPSHYPVALSLGLSRLQETMRQEIESEEVLMGGAGEGEAAADG